MWERILFGWADRRERRRQRRLQQHGDTLYALIDQHISLDAFQLSALSGISLEHVIMALEYLYRAQRVDRVYGYMKPEGRDKLDGHFIWSVGTIWLIRR